MTKLQPNTYKAIFWDLDGTKYPYSAVYENESNNTIANILVSTVATASFDEMLKLVKKSLYEHNDSFKLPSENYNIDPVFLSMKFQNEMPVYFIEQVADNYIAKMNACGVEHGIITHSEPLWTQRVLEKLNLAHLFKSNNVHTHEKYKNEGKNCSSKPFQIALQSLSEICEPSQAIIVEDTQINLKNAKDIGMTTVLVYPKKDVRVMAYVDFVFQTPDHFLTSFIEAKKQPM